MKHKSRVEKLEQRARPPGRIIVQWPGEPEPEVGPEDAVLRVTYHDPWPDGPVVEPPPKG